MDFINQQLATGEPPPVLGFKASSPLLELVGTRGISIEGFEIKVKVTLRKGIRFFSLHTLIGMVHLLFSVCFSVPYTTKPVKIHYAYRGGGGIRKNQV